MSDINFIEAKNEFVRSINDFVNMIVWPVFKATHKCEDHFRADGTFWFSGCKCGKHTWLMLPVGAHWVNYTDTNGINYISVVSIPAIGTNAAEGFCKGICW